MHARRLSSCWGSRKPPSSATSNSGEKQERWLPNASQDDRESKLGPLQAELVAQLQAHNDLGLEDQCRVFEQSHGVRVSTATMSRAIKRIGWTRKKRHWVKASGGRKSESGG